MKTHMKLFILFCLTTIQLQAQEEKVWVTIHNVSVLEQIQNQFQPTSIQKAIPSSRRAELQKVYEITITGQPAELMNFLLAHKDAEQPILEQPYTLLYDPNDYNVEFSNDYALDLVNAKAAWDITHGDANVKIAVADSNFDTLHQELINKYNYISPQIYSSNFDHGTAVAVTAAGNTDNSLGKSSIGFNCELMLYGMNYNHILDATYAGAKVINISWASGCYYNPYQEAIIEEAYDNGSIIVAAAGNGSTCGSSTALVYPAAYDYVIGVSSVGPNDNHERFPGNTLSTHQHNSSVDVCAPGYDVALSIKNNNYLTGNGSSFASPMVAGAVGLMLSVNPCLTYEDVLYILEQTSSDLDVLNPSYAGQLGYGRLDAAAAVAMANNFSSFDFSYNAEYNCSTGNVELNVSTQDTTDMSITWYNGDTTWTIINPSTGNLDFTLTKANGCSTDTSIYIGNIGIEYDYPSNVYIDNASDSLIDYNQDGVIKIKGTLTIENDVEYTISNKNIAFGSNYNQPQDQGNPYSGIIVSKKGILHVENSHLSVMTQCDDFWGGIELRGGEISSSNNGVAQLRNQSSNYEYGVLYMNNSTIENALIGVSTTRKNQPFSTSNTLFHEGQITILDSEFNNNQIALKIAQNSDNGVFQLVKECEFNNNNGIPQVQQIVLKNSLQSMLQENQFNGDNSLPLSERGTGIYLDNSNYNTGMISTYSTSQNINNTFIDLYRGIQAKNETTESLILKIQNNQFNNVHQNILTDGAYSGIVSNNQINIPIGTASEKSWGIYTTEKQDIIITENEFNSLGDDNSTFGTIIIDAQGNYGAVYKNQFSGTFNSASQFEGNNEYLEVSCNQYESKGQYNWSVVAGNLADQGGQMRAGNLFSDCDSVDYQIYVDPSASGFNYSCSSSTVPTCVNGVNVNTITTTSNWTDACPSIIPSLGNIKYEAFELKNLKSSTDTTYEVLNTSNFKNDDLTDENKEAFTVYPNPSNGFFTVTHNLKKINLVEIIDATGKLVWKEDVHQLQKEIQLDKMNTGVYLVNVTLDNNQRLSRKIIIE